MATVILLAAMFVLLWVLLIRPQRRKQMEQQKLLSSVEPGDEVLTVGGMYGIVTEIDEEDDLIVEVAEGIRVRIARRAVAGVVKPEEGPDEADEGDGEGLERPEDEGRVVDSVEIVKEDPAEGAEALDRR